MVPCSAAEEQAVGDEADQQDAGQPRPDDAAAQHREARRRIDHQRGDVRALAVVLDHDDFAGRLVRVADRAAMLQVAAEQRIAAAAPGPARHRVAHVDPGLGPADQGIARLLELDRAQPMDPPLDQRHPPGAPLQPQGADEAVECEEQEQQADGGEGLVTRGGGLVGGEEIVRDQ